MSAWLMIVWVGSYPEKKTGLPLEALRTLAMQAAITLCTQTAKPARCILGKHAWDSGFGARGSGKGNSDTPNPEPPAPSPETPCFQGSCRFGGCWRFHFE